MIAKELEAAGIPVAYVTTLDSLARTVGANRIVKGKAITNVVGDPNLTPEKEKEFRKSLVKRAREALQTDVKEPTVFGA